MVAEYLLKKLKKQMDDVIITEHENISTQIKFVDNKIAKTGTEQLKDISVFAVKNKKIIGTSFREFSGPDDTIKGADTNLSKKKADELIKKLTGFVKFIQPKKDYYGIYENKHKYKKLKNCYDNEIKKMDHVDYVEKGINAALEQGAKRVSGILESHEHFSRVLTSNNIDVKEKGTNFYFSLRALLNKSASGHYNCCSRMLNKFDVVKVGRRAGEIAVMAKNPVELNAGKYDVVFDPLPLTALLSNVVSSLSIFYAESGLSFLGNKLGQKIASSSVNFVDDALMSNGYGSSSFDAEGRPTQKNVLVKNGILKTYYHNTSTSKKYKVKPTGNAGLVDPGGFNFELKKGKISRDKLIKSLDKGLLITNIWYTRFNNYNTGDFSTIPRDGVFLIENGKVVKSLKNLRVSENMLRILNNIDKIGSNSEQISSWEAEHNIKCPSVLIKDVNVTKAKE